MSLFVEEMPKSKRGKVVKLLVYKTQDGMEYKVGFIISSFRNRGSRSGVIAQMNSEKESLISDYSRSLFESCFKQW